MRSFLTALTAAVAVATVFTTRSLLAGFDRGAEEDLARLGLQTVQVMDAPAGFPDGEAVTRREPLGPGDREKAEAAVRATGVGAWVTEARVRPSFLVREDGKPVPVPMVAAGPEYAGTFEARMAEGRFLTSEDAADGAEPVCVLDADAAWALGPEVRVGSVITVAGFGEARTLTVVGIVEDPFHMRPRGHFVDTTAGARRAVTQIFAFRSAYVPLREDSPGSRMILAVADERRDAAKVHDALERSLGARERGLLVWSRGTWARNVLEMMGDITKLLNIIWGIVLAVALVMIATVTLVGVRERFGEVAIRRAEGATRGQVVGQLLVEGGVLTLLGGVAGLPLGRLAAEVLASRLTWRPAPSLPEAVVALALGVLVGVLASALPAWRASRWSVIEGLSRAG